MSEATVRNRTVVITGASGGVGRATARRFAREGAVLALIARGRAGLEGARREAEELGTRALTIPADVADPEAVEAAAERIEDRLGPISIWINNAMTTIFAPLSEIRPAEFKRATEVTYLGAVYGTMAALRRMQPRDEGTIVNVGSALAYRAIPLQSPYCGAKHALRGFTDSVRTELIHEGSSVRITMVHLPGLNTPQFDWCETRLPRRPQPVPPIYQPEIAAEALLYSATHARRELSVGIPTVKSIWGQKLAPRLLDHYVAEVAWDGQMTDEPVAPDRPSNLWEPVEGDHGARGGFSARAQDRSPQLWANLHRTWLFAGAALLAGSVAAAVTRNGR